MSDEWQTYDPWRDERKRGCFCGWEGFVSGDRCPFCQCVLQAKEFRVKPQPIASSFDYQKDFFARRAAARQKPKERADAG